MDDETFEHRVRRIMSGETRGAGAGAARVALRAAEPLYGAITRLRNGLFDRGTLRGHVLPRPVVSVGNLTTGGTGKTPVVQWIARRLLADGHRPVVLMRGYRRESSDVASDEELLLRESLDGVPIVADPNRVAAGVATLEADATIDSFILDDGFQHRRLHRDCDVVVIDATNPFGYGHVLPRGMLREPIAGVARASLVILTRVDGASTETIAEIERTVRQHHPTVPIVRSTHRLDDAVDVDGRVRPLAGAKVLAFSGIGNPAAFERSMTNAGAAVVSVRRFADHHPYRVDDLYALRVAALDAGAEAMVTTEKDWVKLRSLDPTGPGVPTWRAGVRVSFSTTADEATAWSAITSATRLRPIRRLSRVDGDLWTE